MGNSEGMQEVIESNSQVGCTLGYVKELPRTYATELLEKERTRNLAIINECFKDYGIITDGTPSFCKAEAVMLRLVNKRTLEIVQLLVSVRLFDAGLNGLHLASNLNDVLINQCKLTSEGWRVLASFEHRQGLVK
jgi:hypothetical protein